MISIQKVSKIYPSRFNGEPTIALDNVSFEIGEKEFVSIVGKSGAGKTTLLKLILREEAPTKGEIFFEGENVNHIKKTYISKLRQKMGTVFQDYKLFPSKTTYENVAYIMEVIGLNDKDIARDVPQILELVGLGNKMDNFPNELSGGEKQRVAIARALIHRPDVILADEPTGNLDPYNTHGIIKLLEKIYKMGTTVILATHNKEVVNSLSKRIITLDCGKVVRDEEKGRFIL